MAATTQATNRRRYAIRGNSPGEAKPPNVTSSDDEASSYFIRWLKVWVALITVVTLVVVVYLIAITNSLASINGNLAVADTAVGGAGGDTQSLPAQVENINTSLASIDPALAPIPGQADAIIGALTSIDGRLASTDSSLQDTSSSLQNTSSQLVDTSGILQTVLGQAGDIRNTLFAADRPNGDCAQTSCRDDQLGVQNIHQRVAIANNVLIPAKADTAGIIAGLNVVNRNLSSICGTTGLLDLGGLLGGGGRSCPQ